MGNLIVLCKPTSRKAFVAPTSSQHRRIVQAEKLDGKIIEFTTPVLVKDVFGKFPVGGIGLSKKAEWLLPPRYELKLGKLCYLLPGSLPSNSESGSTMAADREQAARGIKRIKVVITKQQLQELLSKQVSVHDDVVSATAAGGRRSSDDSFPYWKPKLQSIPEGIELL